MEKSEFVLKIMEMLKRIWWKAILIILAVGIAFSGYKCQTKKVTIEKTPIKIKIPGVGAQLPETIKSN